MTTRGRKVQPAPEGFYTMKEVAGVMGMTESGVRQRIKKGYIKGTKKGSRIFVSRAELEKEFDLPHGGVPTPTNGAVDFEGLIDEMITSLKSLKKSYRNQEKSIRDRVAKAIVEALSNG